MPYIKDMLLFRFRGIINGYIPKERRVEIIALEIPTGLLRSVIKPEVAHVFPVLSHHNLNTLIGRRCTLTAEIKFRAHYVDYDSDQVEQRHQIYIKDVVPQYRNERKVSNYDEPLCAHCDELAEGACQVCGRDICAVCGEAYGMPGAEILYLCRVDLDPYCDDRLKTEKALEEAEERKVKWEAKEQLLRK